MEKMSSQKTTCKTKPASHCKQKFREEYSKKWTCIAPSRKGEVYARCTLCTCDISIAHGGANDIKWHVQSSKHRSAVQDVAGSSSITTFPLPKDNARIRKKGKKGSQNTTGKTKPASHSKQKFREEYSKKWTFIAPSRKGEVYARCTLCTCDISIAHGGAIDIKWHVQTYKHRSAAQDVAGSSSITKYPAELERSRAASSFLPSGSVPVTNALDMLGYEMSTSLEERIDAQYTSRKELESDRRGQLKKHTKSLIATVSSSYSEKTPLKKCLRKAIDCIKDLKCESSVLTAERYWFIQENRELVEYLHELQEHHGILRSLKLWEDERAMQDWRDSKWDAVPEAEKSRDEMDVHVHEMYTNQYLENVRRQKMQLHAEYTSKRDDWSDALQCKMESGEWCWDRRCPAAPHRIHYGGVRREGDDSWWIPPLEEEDGDDDGWLEDDDKMELDGNKCPAESLHRPCYCPRKPPVAFASKTSTSAPERTNNDFPDEKKVKKRKRSKSKKESVAPAFKIVKQDLNMKDTSVPAKASADPRTSIFKDTGNSSVSDGSKVMVSTLGKLIKLNSLDPSLADKRFYMIQLGRKQVETQKTNDPKSNLKVNLIQICPGKAVLVCKSAAQTNDKLVSVPTSAGHSQPTLTPSKPQVASGSVSLNSLKGKTHLDVGGKTLSTLEHSKQMVTIIRPRVVFRSGNTTNGRHTGKTEVDDKEVSEPTSVGHGQRTMPSFKPWVVPGSTSTTYLHAEKGKALIHEDAKTVSVPVDDGQGKHTATISKSQDAFGSLGTAGLNSFKGKVQVDGKVLSTPGQSQQMMTIIEPHVFPGLMSTMVLNSEKGKAQGDAEVVSGPVSVGNSQHTVTSSKPQVVPGSTSTTYLNAQKGKPLIHVNDQRVSRPCDSGYSQHKIMLGVPHVLPVSISTMDLNSLKAKAQGNAQVVSGPVSMGKRQHTVSLFKPQVVPGSTSTTYLNAQKGKALIHADAKKVSRPADDGHSQRTLIVGKPQGLPGSISTMGLTSPKGEAQVDGKVVSEPSSIVQGQRTLTISQNFLTGSVSLGNLDSRKGDPNVDAEMASGYFCKGNGQVDVSMVSGQPSVSYTRPTVTKVRHETDPGLEVAMGLDSTEVKTQDDVIVTEEMDKSSSPISCMLCDEPFDNVAELQSHLINSHAS